MNISPPNLAPSVSERDDPAVAASKLEAFFIRQFLAQARPSSDSMLDGGFAGDTFREMLDTRMADAIADAGGLGLAASFEAAMARAPGVAKPPNGPDLFDQLDSLRAGAGDMVKPAPGRFSSGFGERLDPLGNGKGFHPGLDIAARTGTPVVAAAAGRVIHAGPAGTYGNMIAVQMADGTETRYAHLSAVDVKVGDLVGAGAHLGAVGSTGRSTGPHLHFEVRQAGKAVDPRPFLDGPTVEDPRRSP